MSLAVTLGPFMGEVPKPNSALQKPNAADEAIDCYLDTGAIRPVRTDRLVSTGTGIRLYAGPCCIKTLPSCDTISRTDLGCPRVFISGTGYPTYASHDDYCAGITIRMDWPCTMPAPDTQYFATGGAILDEQVAMANGAVVTKGLATPRSYFYTWVNQYGDESPPSEVSYIAVQDYDNPALLSGFMTPPAANFVVSINIYSLVAGVEDGSAPSGGGQDSYFLVATIPVTQSTFLHNPSASLLLDAYVNEGQSSVDADAKDVQWLFDDRIAYLSNDRLHFSEPGNYTRVHDKYTLAFRDRPLKFVATERSGYVLTCGRPEVVDLTKQCDGNGCKNVTTLDEHLPIIGAESTCVYAGSVFYASVAGIVAINGVHASVITDDLFTQDQWDALIPNEIRTAVHRGFLYIVSPIKVYRIKLAATAYSKPDAGDMVQLSIRPTAILATFDDRLLYADAVGTWEMEQGVGLKNYTWTRELKFNSWRTPGAVRASFTSGHLHISETRTAATASFATTRVYDNVPNNRPFRLGRVITPSYKITLTGTAELYQLKLAGSTNELGS
jgi:hypothetical protein